MSHSRQIKLGTTVSFLQLASLGLDQNAAILFALEMKFDYLRLGFYWSEIEKEPGVLDWTMVEHVLDLCQKQGQDVVFVVGVKSPRYPEFFTPSWLVDKPLNHPDFQKKLLNFVDSTIKRLAKYTCIKYWQVENEPLDPSGPHNDVITQDLLSSEVQTVHSLDDRPIVLTAWGNQLSKRQTFPRLLELADVVGLDIYYKQFAKKIFGKSIYLSPDDSDQQLLSLVNSSQKPVWITELQAEPWECDESEYRHESPPSMSVQLLAKNYERAKKIQAAAIFFWGFEYWLFQYHRGQRQYIDLIRQIIDDDLGPLQ